MNLIQTAGLITMLVAGAHCAPGAETQSENDGSRKRGTFDLSFKGGTPAQLLAAMEKAAANYIRDPEPVNALVPAELADLRIPPMELRAVTVASVFEALSFLDTNIRWVRAREGIWTLTRREQSKTTQAFYVGHLLKKFKIADITTAVKTTWQMGGEDPKAELKYHEDTQLLIARANQREINMMMEVIAQLRLAVEPGLPVPGPKE